MSVDALVLSGSSDPTDSEMSESLSVESTSGASVCVSTLDSTEAPDVDSDASLICSVSTFSDDSSLDLSGSTNSY